MATSIDNNPEWVDQQIDNLIVIARGNIDLVEDVLIKSIKVEIPQWWQFWKTDRIYIDFVDAIKLVIQEVKKIDDIKIADEL